VDARLERIRDLIDKREAIDTELSDLFAGGDVAPKPKRGRPRIEKENGNGADTSMQEQ
jgi:hypothetical protein